MHNVTRKLINYFLTGVATAIDYIWDLVTCNIVYYAFQVTDTALEVVLVGRTES